MSGDLAWLGPDAEQRDLVNRNLASVVRISRSLIAQLTSLSQSKLVLVFLILGRPAIISRELAFCSLFLVNKDLESERVPNGSKKRKLSSVVEDGQNCAGLHPHGNLDIFVFSDELLARICLDPLSDVVVPAGRRRQSCAN